MIVIALLATLIGVSLGLLGGGGSILAVPVLTYAAGLSAKEAIATSLLVVGTTAIIALISYAKRGLVEWATGAVFSVTAMMGAYLGGLAADWFSGTVLLLMFAVMMVVTSLGMFRDKKELKQRASDKLPLGLVILEGLAVGGATGLVGAGGGFLVVPALVVIGGMPMHKAIGTSLMVIALKSFAAFAGHASHVAINYELAAIVTGAAVFGSLIGSKFSEKVPAKTLRKGFAVFVLLMAAYVLWREANVYVSMTVLVASAAILVAQSSLKVQPVETEL